MAISTAAGRARDVVCGMDVALDADASFSETWRGSTLHFCSEGCRQAFRADPARFVPGTLSATTGVADQPGSRVIHVPLPHVGPATTASVEDRLAGLGGVESVRGNPAAGQIDVTYDAGHVGVEQIVDALQAAGANAPVATTRLGIEGVFCSACATVIERSLEQAPGVVVATLNPVTDEATVAYEPRRTDLEELRAAVEEAGYRVGPPAAESQNALERQEADRQREYCGLLRRFWFAAAVSVPVVILSYPDLFGLDRWGFFAEGSNSLWWVWRGLGVVTLPVLIWAGGQFYAGAWQALRHRTANMHTLIALGISAAWLYSTVAVIAPSIFPEERFAEVYYDVSAVVVALVTLGLALERGPRAAPRRRSASWSGCRPRRRACCATEPSAISPSRRCWSATSLSCARARRSRSTE